MEVARWGCSYVPMLLRGGLLAASKFHTVYQHGRMRPSRQCNRTYGAVDSTKGLLEIRLLERFRNVRQEAHGGGKVYWRHLHHGCCEAQGLRYPSASSVHTQSQAFRYNRITHRALQEPLVHRRSALRATTFMVREAVPRTVTMLESSSI